jgi:tRNA pseudouridine38-40 synthase
MPRYALRLAYDGTAYRGWWRHPDGTGVADRLDAACRRIGEAGGVVGACRTDAGVHAEGQVAHLDCCRERPAASLPDRLNRQLPADLVCLAAARVPTDWHAVHTAVGKIYRYRLHVGRLPDPFVATQTWRRPGPTRERLIAAAAPLVGEHDFTAFVRRGDHRHDHRCRIETIEWTADGDELVCRIAGDRFIMRLVRSLIGLMVATATGQVDRRQITAAFAGQVNAACRHQAPAHGLCLERITHDPEPAWEAVPSPAGG